MSKIDFVFFDFRGSSEFEAKTRAIEIQNGRVIVRPGYKPDSVAQAFLAKCAMKKIAKPKRGNHD